MTSFVHIVQMVKESVPSDQVYHWKWVHFERFLFREILVEFHAEAEILNRSESCREEVENSVDFLPSWYPGKDIINRNAQLKSLNTEDGTSDYLISFPDLVNYANQRFEIIFNLLSIILS